MNEGVEERWHAHRLIASHIYEQLHLLSRAGAMACLRHSGIKPSPPSHEGSTSVNWNQLMTSPASTGARRVKGHACMNLGPTGAAKASVTRGLTLGLFFRPVLPGTSTVGLYKSPLVHPCTGGRQRVLHGPDSECNLLDRTGCSAVQCSSGAGLRSDLDRTGGGMGRTKILQSWCRRGGTIPKHAGLGGG